MCLGGPSAPKVQQAAQAPQQPAQRIDPNVLARRKKTEDKLRGNAAAANRLFSGRQGPLQTARTTSQSLTEV